jgi:multiple sugar transport system substrate-binding protein
MKDDLAATVLNAFRYQQQIWAFPFLVNYQLFFYNTTMLDKAELTPPTTLDDMVNQMIFLKQQGIVKYPWTDAWRQGENLVCEYVWLTGAFGGSLFDKDDNPIFDQGAGLKALQFMTMLIEQQLAHPNILMNDDIAAKNDFVSGEAAFTTNWVFLEGLLRYTLPTEQEEEPADEEESAEETVQDTAFRAEVGLIPVAKSITAKSASVSGFQGLGITSKPDNQNAAWKWIAFLTSPLVQRAFLYEMPIWKSVQTSEDTLLLDPNMPIKQTQLENVQHRPKLSQYPKISKVLQQALSLALQGQLLPAEALKAAKLEIETMMKAAPETVNEE